MQYKIQDIEQLENCTELLFELVEGKIYPKESSFFLHDEQIAYLLKQNFNTEWLFNNIPMASIKHKILIAELQSLIYTQISTNPIYRCFGEGCEVLVSKKYFSFRKPDITISLRHQEIYEKEKLKNSISIIEVLSPSTQDKDLNEKKQEYFNIDSLQEYILVSQDLPKIQQFLRQNKTSWTMKIYDSLQQTCIMTVGVKIHLGKLYENI